MVRLIRLINKQAGNCDYACDGSGCDKCIVRFKCLTASQRDTLNIDWSMISTKRSPTRVLEDSTGSRIYVKGSKRYYKIVSCILYGDVGL